VHIFDDFHALLAHGAVPSMLSEVLHPQLVVEVGDGFTLLSQKVVKQLF
jgi:hypothetical protein